MGTVFVTDLVDLQWHTIELEDLDQLGAKFERGQWAALVAAAA